MPAPTEKGVGCELGWQEGETQEVCSVAPAFPHSPVLMWKALEH